MITRFLIVCSLIVLGTGLAIAWMTGVKGASGTGAASTTSSDEDRLSESLNDTVKELSFEIGARSLNRFSSMQKAVDRIGQVLRSFGYTVEPQTLVLQGKRVENLVVQVPGSTMANEIVLVGAHYDSYLTTPGANCNASGVAVLIELAKRLRSAHPTRTLRLAFFANGESPWQGTEFMGSRCYAEAAKERGDVIVLALLLDAVGYYSKEPDSQSFPFPLSTCYPKTGDFIAFFGTPTEKAVVRKLLASWPAHSSLPAEGGAVPAWFPGIHGADHLSFVDQGYPGILVTDTAESRWKDARTNYDSCARLDYASMARLTIGLEGLILEVAASGVK